MQNECAINSCTNNAGRTDKSISIHTFPRKGDIRKSFILACKRADDFNPDIGLIGKSCRILLRDIVSVFFGVEASCTLTSLNTA